MSKRIVTVYCPAIGEEHDVFIPNDLSIDSVVKLLGKCFESLSDGNYVSSGHELLCMYDKNMLLDYRCTLYDYGIQNGDRLLLF